MRLKLRSDFRLLAHRALRAALPLLLHLEVVGRHNLRHSGPLLVVTNHLAHVDVPLVMSLFDRPIEGLVAADVMFDSRVGVLLRWYGAIPVQRGEIDRTALRRALEVLRQGGILGLAPEGRISRTGALERGRSGAAYLASLAGVPLQPVALTGTQHAYAAWRRLRRPRVRVRIGPPFALPQTQAQRRDLAHTTELVMLSLACLLPPAYRGEYARYEAAHEAART
jgi:1-acyl-sn-glycerol-3-phosphate acyltransferase